MFYLKSKNNCHGIMHWPNGVRQLRVFNTPEDSHNECVRIWSTYYKAFPGYTLADKWTGGDSTYTWLYNVKTRYNELTTNE